MIKITLRILLLLSVMSLASACGNNNDEPTPPAKTETVERTVLVYMVAHNSDLGGGGWDEADITEMRAAASTGGLGNNGRLIVMHQNSKNNSVLKEITQKGIDTLAVYDSSESSLSVARMRRVFDDMRRLAPARNYGLVLWSHGTGWLQNGISDDYKNGAPRRAFGLDGNKQMNITSLAGALEGQHFEYVYFDCCHMASVEVAYELRHTTPLIVASVAELPSPGMPYDENVPMLISGDAAAAAANTFRYYDEMNGMNRTCTMSVIYTDALDELAAATRSLYANARPLPANTLLQKFERTQICRHYDLEHYAELIAPSAEAFETWRKTLDKAVLYKAATPRIFNRLTIERHCGLSTYVATAPDDMAEKGYNTLQWASDVVPALPWIE